MGAVRISVCEVSETCPRRRSDERRLRYVVCFNPEEAARQQAHRRRLLDHLEAELAAMGDAAQDVQSKRVAALRSSHRYGRYLALGAKGRCPGIC